MKDLLHSEYQHLDKWLREGRLIHAKDMQLMPVEALKNQDCTPGVINLYHNIEAANEADSSIDFDQIAADAKRIVDQEN